MVFVGDVGSTVEISSVTTLPMHRAADNCRPVIRAIRYLEGESTATPSVHTLRQSRRAMRKISYKSPENLVITAKA
jgi:hypothetical protein